MECFVAPFNASYNQLNEALMDTLGELGLSAQIDHWQLAWLKVSAAPHIEVYQFGNPATIAVLLKSPYFKLAPEDIVVLEGDPAVRQRYTELVVETWLPPLRVMVDLFTMQVRLKTCALSWHPPLHSHAIRITRARQMHLNDGVGIERLEALMPKTLGITWAAALGSPNAPLSQACSYARQLESVAARWQSGDHSMLQPVVAYPHMVVAMIMVELKKEAGRKELELLGQSSGARTAAGGTDWAQKGGEQAT
jgi:hypothetical protein